MKKLGLIAFANDGGLGAQTRRLFKLLNPSKILVIDSSKFSKNKQQNFEWYPKEKTTIVRGLPRNCDVVKFIEGLTHVFTVENPYNFYLIHACKKLNIKTICQTNYEFCENVYSQHLPVPDLFLMPSFWMIDEMKKLFGKNKVIYLPPPIDPDEFKEARETNLKRSENVKRKFLHIVGTLAWKDRNGTLDLLEAVKKTKTDYKLVIRSQHELPKEYIIDDPRVEYRVANVKKNSDLYKGFDATILPRRYGGLSLTTNESLMSALPVIMTNISPNNKLLPDEWLIPAIKVGDFQARAIIKYYSANHNLLAEKIDEFATRKLGNSKKYAYGIARDIFSEVSLEESYNKL